MISSNKSGRLVIIVPPDKKGYKRARKKALKIIEFLDRHPNNGSFFKRES